MTPNYDLVKAKDRKNFNKAKSVIRYLVSLIHNIEDKRTLINSNNITSPLSVAFSDNLFKSSFHQLFNNINRNPDITMASTSFGSLSYISIYDKILKNTNFLDNENSIP